MNKYIIGIDGMRCGGCEAHVQDVIRRNFSITKVKASHLRNEVLVFCDHDLNVTEFNHVFEPTGYRITSFKKEEAKKTLFGYK